MGLQSRIIFLISLAVILGATYMTHLHLDRVVARDHQSYLKMARGDFDVSVTHRYRIIIPFAAAALNAPMEFMYKRIWPERAMSDFSLRLCFFLINSLLMAVAMVLIFRLCLEYGVGLFAATIAWLAVISSRWVQVMAGIPLTDSLYLLVLAWTLLAIKLRSTSLLVAAILLGPLAKESYIMLLPVVLWAAYKWFPWYRQLLWMLASGVLFFAFRAVIDYYAGTGATEGVQNAIRHLGHFEETFLRLASLKGIGEILSVYSLFSIIFILGFTGGKAAIKSWLSKLDVACIGLILIIIIHMFMSVDAGRMMYFASPAFAVIMALIIDRHPYFVKLRTSMRVP